MPTNNRADAARQNRYTQERNRRTRKYKEMCAALNRMKLDVKELGKAITRFTPKWNRTSGGFKLDYVGQAAESVSDARQNLDSVIRSFNNTLDWLDCCYEVEYED